MYIESLTLESFRNYGRERAVFSPGLNILKGINASGKTNLLEAVYVAGVGKSLRTSQDKEMVKWGAEEAVIKLFIMKRRGRRSVEIRIDKKGKKKVLIDGIPQVKISELLGCLGIVFFSPEELRLIKDGPTERRRFMDISLCQQSKRYLKNLSMYNKALLQRNKLLKMSYRADSLKNMLDVFDVQLARSGAAVISIRQKFAKNISEIAGVWHYKISGGREKLALSYESIDGSEDLEVELIESLLLKQLAENRSKDIDTSFTNVGPHRDDLKVTVNGIDIRKYGSQGQQRSSALSLKLAEIKSFEIETGETPILLLDDVLSELDLERQANLICAAEGIQTILTCTHFNLEAKDKRKDFIISEGSIVT